MRTCSENITARRATQLLGSVGKKRSLSKILARTYARDMMAGAWMPSPQGLVVRRDHADGERLEDGWHRCAAIAHAARELDQPGFAVPMTVTYLDPGDPPILDVLDTGRSRTFADQLNMDGRTHYAQLAAIVRKLWDWDTGQPWMRRRNPTRHELRQVLGQAEPKLEAAARYGHSWGSATARMILPPTMAGFAWFLFQERVMAQVGGKWVISGEDTSDDAQWFLGHLASGAELDEGSALLAFRKRQLEGAGTVTPRGRSANFHLAALVVTWNHYRLRNPVSKILLPRAVSNEKFPRPI